MHVLLVHPDADEVAARLSPAATRAGCAVTPAPSALAARAYLASAAFDAVAVLDDADAAVLTALAEQLHLPTPVHRFDDERALAAWVGGAEEPVAGGASEASVLADAERELAHLAHALNNPLAVIAGNAQLGRELAAASGAGPDVAAAFADIEAGAADLSRLLARIGAVRAQLQRARGGGPAERPGE